MKNLSIGIGVWISLILITLAICTFIFISRDIKYTFTYKNIYSCEKDELIYERGNTKYYYHCIKDLKVTEEKFNIKYKTKSINYYLKNKSLKSILKTLNKSSSSYYDNNNELIQVIEYYEKKKTIEPNDLKIYHCVNGDKIDIFFSNERSKKIYCESLYN